MPFFRQAAFWLLLATFLPQSALARRKPLDENLSPKPAKATLISPEEGSAILETAFEKRFRSAHDCSHFVHKVYEQAGYPFAYAPASNLYKGVPEFRYVKRPQPGDLVVWRGHAGIVTDPRNRAFFSVLSTGLRTDYYDSKYWKRRGHARFYRYKKLPLNFEEESAEARRISIPE